MAQRIHLGADLADFAGDELLVSDRLALVAVRPARRAAGHPQRVCASRRDRHLRVIGMPRLTISPVLMSLTTSSTLSRVMRLPLPRWSSRPQHELNQSAFRTGLTLFDSASSSLMEGAWAIRRPGRPRPRPPLPPLACRDAGDARPPAPRDQQPESASSR